tara:strand:+ start:608 stop:874 length:267 start_codon:yes stop_codon:yes gene_type:complete
MNKQKIIKQLDMIGRKVDIITEGYTKNQIEENIEHFIDNDTDDKEMLSTCCGYSALTEIHINNESKEVEAIAICSKCRDWADFEYEEY